MSDNNEVLDQGALDFIRELATELSSGTVQLPSYPEAAMRVQRALSSEDVDLETVVRAISAEPLLAVRIMQMANSARINAMGRPIPDLRKAVTRLGYNMVRIAAMTFVMQQLQLTPAHAPVQQQLAGLWRLSVNVAALVRTITIHHSRLNPDVAVLVGLLHAVGKLCIHVRLAGHPELLARPEVCARILADWHSDIGGALLSDWGMADEVIDAVRFHADADRELPQTVDFTDVLAAAVRIEALREQLASDLPSPETVLPVLQEAPQLWAHLQINAEAMLSLLVHADEEIRELQLLLGG
jgi:HD-like signal output (HDOD) protein